LVLFGLQPVARSRRPINGASGGDLAAPESAYETLADFAGSAAALAFHVENEIPSLIANIASRISWKGPAQDLSGRAVGKLVGAQAWAKALTYFNPNGEQDSDGDDE
jgi:hypothetical protein